MKKIRFVAFKGISIISRLIEWWTNSEYSHIAIALDIKEDIPTIEAWQSGFKNVKWGYYNVADNHTPQTPYEIWEIELPSNEWKICMDFYHMLADEKVKYDWLGIFGFILPFIKDSKRGRFCSEGAIEPLINSCGWSGVPSKIDPGTFVRMIREFGAEKNKIWRT